MPTQLQLRRDTAANWTSTNPVLAEGEPGIETDTGKTKYGNGQDPWNSLQYAYGRPDILDELADVEITDPPQNGQVLRYDGNVWAPSSTAGTTGTVSVYDTFEQLAIANPQIGQMAFVNDTQALYIWVGNLWYNIAISDQAFSITGNEPSYTLTAGSDTVVTLIAVDPEGNDINWSYQVIAGSLNDTTVDLQNNVFIVTPGSNNANFTIRWSATDGVNTITAQSIFSLVVDSTQTSWANYEQVSRIFPGLSFNDQYGIGGSSVSGDRPAAGWLTDSAFFVIANSYSTQRGRFVIIEQSGTQWNVVRATSVTADSYTRPMNILVQKRVATQFFKSNSTDEWDIWFWNNHFAGLSKMVIRLTTNGSWDSEYFDYGNTTYGSAERYISSGSYSKFDILNNTLITGNGGTSVGGLTSVGQVNVFTRLNELSRFTLEATITAPDLDQYEYFGNGVAIISETEIVIGAYGSEDSGQGTDSGTLYLYKKSGGDWNYEGRLPSPTELDGNDFLGRNLLYKHGLLFSYYSNAGTNFDGGPGRCFVYKKDDNGDWVYVQLVPVPTGYNNTLADMFSVIDFDGTTFIQSDLSTNDSTFVYEWDGTSMNYITELNPSATFTKTDNQYGVSPIVRGNYIAVQARGDSSPVVNPQTFVYEKK